MLLDKLTNAGLKAIKNIQNKNADKKPEVLQEDDTKTQKQLEMSLDAAAIMGKASIMPSVITLPEVEQVQEITDIKTCDSYGDDEFVLWEESHYPAHIGDSSLESVDQNKEETEWAVNTFKQYGIDAKADEEGYITISHYAQPKDPEGKNRDWEYTFRKLGIDEDKLFERVKEVEGDCDWSDASISAAPNLEKVGGNFTVGRFGAVVNDPVKDPESLPALKYVGGNLNINSPNLEELPSLEKVKGSIDCFGSNMDSVPALKEVYGGINLYGAYRLKELPALEYVKGAIIGAHKNFESMPKLRIAGDIKLSGSVKDLSSLVYVVNDLDIKYNDDLKKLPSLEFVGGRFRANNTIEDLSHLMEVDKGLDIYLHDESSEIKDESGVKTIIFNPRVEFPKLEKLGGDSYIRGGRFVAPKLEEIEKIDTYNNNINYKLFSDCPKLKTIGNTPISEIDFSETYPYNRFRYPV